MRLAYGLFGGFLVIASLLAAPAVTSAGPILVDDFLTAQGVSQLGPGGPTTNGPIGGSHLGGRTLSVTQGMGSFPAAMASITIAGGLASFTTSTLTDTATFVLDYAGFGSLDISGLAGILVPFATFDSDGNPLPVTVTLFDAAAAMDSEMMSVPANQATPFDLVFPLGAFAGVDLTQITGFRFQFDSSNLPGPNQAQDFTLGDGGIRITETPEPGTLALLAGMLGITGLWYSRRARVRCA